MSKKTQSREQAASAAPTRRVRDRIFDVACELFYERGIRAKKGIDY